jgi:DNA mismatch repair protein MutS2
VFADIGDEQSISESLSTFSAHLANLRHILAGAGPDSMVLVDEMGTGTDPQEGAALARAILEELVRRGTLVVVTSHLGALKRLDGPGSGVVNASLQFDPDRIEPTFHFQKGRPGRSYGLAIARRLGFPHDLLDRAEGHLPAEEARMEDLLATLERKEKEASALVESLAQERARAERLGKELRAREEELRVRERTAEARAREEARQLLLEARKEVEAAIREVRAAAEEARTGGAGEPEAEELEEVIRRARRRVEEAARHHREGAGGARPAEAHRGFAPGDRVSLAGSGAEGRVLEVRDGRVLVETAGVRLLIPVVDLVFKSGPVPAGEERPRAAREAASSWQGPEAEASPELDLRGLRVTEIDLEVDRAVDRAVLAGLGELRIIHGKGTGALRERVAELLAADSRVKEFRLGLHGEGGGGVTIVRLR